MYMIILIEKEINHSSFDCHKIVVDVLTLNLFYTYDKFQDLYIQGSEFLTIQLVE